MFLLNKVYSNKLMLHFRLMIFIGLENNRYFYICYTQENIIFYSIHTIFYEEIFSKCTDSYAKKHNLYNKLLKKISLEKELLVSSSSSKDRSALVLISHISISSIQKNFLTHFSLLFLSYKSLFYLPTLKSKKPICYDLKSKGLDQRRNLILR